MLSVALTGNVASGKSTVARIWADAGVPVIGADELARRAVARGSHGLAEVREAFGGEVITPQGELDRAAMRERVFGDDEARARLEAIVHPRVWSARERWLEERRAEGAELVVSEIPLLFETRRETDFDVVVLVDAPLELRLARMVESRGLDEGEARRIAEAQMDAATKRGRSDHVLDNAGSPEELRAAALELLGTLRDPPLLRMDLHMHTWGSWDCLSDPGDNLERALARGVGRIALTDHDRLGVALEAYSAHPTRVIPGEEVRTAEGVDLIGLYLREEIPGGTPAAEVAERAREQGGVVYLPHPYAPGKGGGGSLAEVLAALSDVVETFNARLHPASRNEPAEALARRHGKLRGAGSDAHTVAEVGNAWVEVAAHPNEPSAFLRALRRARVQGSEASRLVHLASTWAKVRRLLPGSPGP
ncbi:MAG: dephospho-CoA kinase [Gemmatimonadota bacterium]